MTEIRLTPEQDKKMNDWLRLKRVVADCPACTSNDWFIDQIVTARGITGVSDTPMVQVVCRNCYHILLFNARAIGLV